MARYCGNCGNEIDEKAYICPKCGVLVNQEEKETTVKKLSDNGGLGWGILGFFVPIAGLVLYLIWKNNKPLTAKSAGMGALISVIVGVIIYSLIMILFGIIFTIDAANL